MNKRTEQTRWTPKRLLSLLMALIMTLSLLPTAALAADSSPTSTGTGTQSDPISITCTGASGELQTLNAGVTDNSSSITLFPQLQ